MKTTHRSKRYRACLELIQPDKAYSLPDAVETLKKLPPTKFDQTVPSPSRWGEIPNSPTRWAAVPVPWRIGAENKYQVLDLHRVKQPEPAKKLGPEKFDSKN